MKKYLRISLILFFVLSFGSLFSAPKAVYQELPDDVSLKEWLVCGPFKVLPVDTTDKSEAVQKKAFNAPIPSADVIEKSLSTGVLNFEGKSCEWAYLKSESDIIDLRKEVSDHNFEYVLAAAQIKCPKAQSRLWGIGSDDGIKIWVNGKPVHENWIGRAVSKDDDLVEISLEKGMNTILIKIQNMEYGWGFTIRPLGPEMLAENLIRFAGLGNMDLVELLLAHDAAINHKIDLGITALHAAQLNGRQEIVELLLKKGADESIEMPAPEQLIAFMMNKAVKENYPGAAILVARDGKILYENGFGLANVEKGVKITPVSTFRIGSITKQFTASAILKLQEQGKLTVQDKLSKFYPDFPRGDEVTLHHLLTHTSGIHSFTNAPDFMDYVTQTVETEAMIEKIKSYDFDFNPGESWAYSNSGFYLLSAIVEKVSGETFDEFLKKNFFNSLKMKNTGVYSKKVNFKHEALGYAFENDSVKLALDWDMSVAGGAGNIYSNVEDLFHWNEGIFNGKVLLPKSLKMAFTPVKLNNGEAASAFSGKYGYGWMLLEFRGLQEISHTGGLNGFNSALIRLPEKKVTVAVLSNALPNIPGLNPSVVAHEAAQIYLWKELKPQMTYTVSQDFDTTKLDDYLGRYDYMGQGVLEITRDGDRLFTQMTGQRKFEIFPCEKDEFFWKVVDARVHFERDTSGKVTSLTHYQGGTNIKAAKMADETATDVDATVYEDYVGEYQLMPGFIVTITHEGDHLFAQATNQPKFEVFPRTETEFFYKVVNAQLTFVKEPSGEVTHMLLKQGGTERKADKIK